jgi:hypothetical protein
MTEDREPFATSEIEPGVLAGPFRRARNRGADLEGGIHADQEAQKLGLRGGAVAGSVHLDQFPPLLTALLGRAWFQTGSISLYFRYPTRDKEAVRCFARRPTADPADNDVQIQVWVDHENGERVAEGTASVGAPDKDSAVQRRVASVPQARDLRILADLKVGRRASGIPARIRAEAMDRSLPAMTEPMQEYRDESVWGGRVASPSAIVGALLSVQGGLLDSDTWITGIGEDYGVRLFGAIELQALKGPVFVERDYEIGGSILAVGETPQTEYYWFDSVLSDPSTGQGISRMIMMMRSMKASHKAWR